MTSVSPLPHHQFPARTSPSCAQCYRATNSRKKQHEASVCASQSVHVWIKPPRVTAALLCCDTTRQWRKLSPSVGQPDPLPNSACPDHPLKTELSTAYLATIRVILKRDLLVWVLDSFVSSYIHWSNKRYYVPLRARLGNVSRSGRLGSMDRAGTKASVTTTQPSTSWLRCSICNHLKV